MFKRVESELDERRLINGILAIRCVVLPASLRRLGSHWLHQRVRVIVLKHGRGRRVGRWVRGRLHPVCEVGDEPITVKDKVRPLPSL